jgi:FkbM family methyltransferase
MGRRSLYRFSRFLIFESRRDVPNFMGSNGERLVQATVLRHAPQAVIFDVGANVGDWTAGLFQLADGSGAGVTVHAFEPCAGTFQALRERIDQEQWTNVIAVPQACSVAPGKAAMTVYSDGYGTNTIVAPIEPAPTARKETVELTSVDVYCACHSIKHIHLLKIDVEGHDFDVILGATQMLRRAAIDVLQFEYNQRWIGPRRCLHDAFMLLEPLGYAVGKVTPKGIEFYAEWHWEMETYCEANYLACTPDWAARFKRLAPTWLIGS